jgi:hypothetical protein
MVRQRMHVAAEQLCRLQTQHPSGGLLMKTQQPATSTP